MPNSTDNRAAIALGIFDTLDKIIQQAILALQTNDGSTTEQEKEAISAIANWQMDGYAVRRKIWEAWD